MRKKSLLVPAVGDLLVTVTTVGDFPMLRGGGRG